MPIISRKERNHKLAGKTLERGTPAGPIYINISADLASNQTTADVKERNNTTVATWDYQYFACE